MAKHGDERKTRERVSRSAILGRVLSPNRATRQVTDEGIARLRARGASDEFLKAARGHR